MRGNLDDQAWADRFFARQREEILAAVRTERARSRVRRRAGLALSAAAALLVLALWPLLPGGRPAVTAGSAAETVASTPSSFEDPLAVYDAWDDTATGLEFPDVPGAGLARFLAGEDPAPAQDDPQALLAGGARKG